jgi:hypothetical protein
MLYLAIGGLVFGVLGIAWALTCYWKLWQWARQCQYARIVVAHKRKVRLNAPIVEWLLWCNMLDKDKDASGRVVYTDASTSVAIVKKSFVAKSPVHEFAGWLLRRKRTDSNIPQVKQGVQPRTGKWVAKDETVKP